MRADAHKKGGDRCSLWERSDCSGHRDALVHWLIILRAPGWVLIAAGVQLAAIPAGERTVLRQEVDDILNVLREVLRLQPVVIRHIVRQVIRHIVHQF